MFVNRDKYFAVGDTVGVVLAVILKIMFSVFIMLSGMKEYKSIIHTSREHRCSIYHTVHSKR